MQNLDDRAALDLLTAIVVCARREASRGCEEAQRFMAELAELPRPRSVRFAGAPDRRASEIHPAGRRR